MLNYGTLKYLSEMCDSNTKLIFEMHHGVKFIESINTML